MFESNSGNLIQKSEALALKEIDKLSNLYGEVLTKKEIIERIRDINKSIALYDLLIESDTFSNLIGVTNLTLPRVKDRIYSALLYLFSKLDPKPEQKDIINYIEYAITLVFSWDKELSKQITNTIEDLKKFIDCKNDKELQSCTLDMIKKYKFRKDLYDFALKETKKETNELEAQYLNSLAYIEQIGSLISIYETFDSDLNTETKMLDISISLIEFTINQLNLDSFSIPHIIPSLLRSIIRKQGYAEPQILEMKINEIIYLAKKDEVGKTIIKLAQALASQDKLILTSSRTGERLFFELLYKDFWGKLEYLPEISLLEHIAKIAKIETPPDADKSKEKLYKKAGELNALLYGETD